MNHKTDSLGTPLPQSVFLQANATLAQLDRALTVNTFNLSASLALQKGREVIYDAAQKQAIITDQDGMASIISHL